MSDLSGMHAPGGGPVSGSSSRAPVGLLVMAFALIALGIGFFLLLRSGGDDDESESREDSSDEETPVTTESRDDEDTATTEEETATTEGETSTTEGSATTTATSTGTGETQADPIPVGTAATLDTWDIAVVSFNPNATEIVRTDAGTLFSDPESGLQYGLLAVTATYHGEDDSISPFIEFDLELLDAAGEPTLEDSACFPPDPAIEAPDVAPGQSVDFNVCFQIDPASAYVLAAEETFSFDETRTYLALV